MKKVKIGNVELKNNLILAPMAGVTNEAFRTICMEKGAGLVYAEMVSDKGLLYSNQKTHDMIKVSDAEHPISMQLFGSSADTILSAAKIVETAKRELMEETGAIEFDIKPVCVYSVKGKTRVSEKGEENFGMLFFADIFSFEEVHSEIEKILITDTLVEDWTYPLIQPKLIEEAQRRGVI